MIYRLAVREFSENDDNYELSDKATTASYAVKRCRAKEIVYTEPDQNKTVITKSVTQGGGEVGEDSYEVMHTYTMLQRDGPGIGDDNIYVVPDNNIATTMRGKGVREDTYDVPYNTVNTAATIAMGSRGGERESAVYEDIDNPRATTFRLRAKFELH